jgi:hypothetical protein
LDFSWLLGIEETNKAYQFGTDLVANLIRTIRIEDDTKELQELVKIRKERWTVILEKMKDGAESGSVLEVIIFEGKGGNKCGENLLKRDRSSITDNQTSDGTSGIVLCIETRPRAVSSDIEQWPESGEEMKILGGEVDCGVLDEEARGKGSITEDFSIGVTKRLVEELQERLGQWGNSLLHSTNHLSEATDSRRPVTQRATLFLSKHQIS